MKIIPETKQWILTTFSYTGATPGYVSPPIDGNAWRAAQPLDPRDAEIASLRAENAALKAKLEWREGHDGTTHSESCYQWHWHCAMQRIEGMEAKPAEPPTISADVVEAVEIAAAQYQYEHHDTEADHLTQAAAALRATHTITGGNQ